MSKTNFVRNITKVNSEVCKHSPAILILLGIAGMTSTVFMACKATKKTQDILDDIEEEIRDLEPKDKLKEEIKAVAPVYIPSVIMGGLSIACIIGSYSITSRRTAALATAYSISERTLHEYQDKVIETIGKRKEERIRDEIAKDHIKNDPPETQEIIETGRGDMLCYDSLSGRYFKSGIDIIRKAESILNRRLISEMYVSLNDFYDEIDICHTRIGDDLGWNVDDLIEFSFSSQLTDDNTPCLVVDYDICPRYDYRNLM